MASMTEVFASQIWDAFVDLMAHHGARPESRYGNVKKVLHGVSGYPVFVKDIDGGFIRFHLEHLKGESYEVAVCYPGQCYESVVSSFGLDVDAYIGAIGYLTDTVVEGAKSVKYEAATGEFVRQGKGQIHPTLTEEAQEIIAKFAREHGVKTSAAVEMITRSWAGATQGQDAEGDEPETTAPAEKGERKRYGRGKFHMSRPSR